MGPKERSAWELYINEIRVFAMYTFNLVIASIIVIVTIQQYVLSTQIHRWTIKLFEPIHVVFIGEMYYEEVVSAIEIEHFITT